MRVVQLCVGAAAFLAGLAWTLIEVVKHLRFKFENTHLTDTQVMIHSWHQLSWVNFMPAVLLMIGFVCVYCRSKEGDKR